MFMYTECTSTCVCVHVSSMYGFFNISVVSCWVATFSINMAYYRVAFGTDVCVQHVSWQHAYQQTWKYAGYCTHRERERGRQALTGMLKIVLTMCTDHVRCSVSCRCLPFVVFMNVRMWNSFATALHSAYLMRSCDSCSATLQPCPATLSPYVCGICKNSFIT